MVNWIDAIIPRLYGSFHVDINIPFPIFISADDGPRPLRQEDTVFFHQITNSMSLNDIKFRMFKTASDWMVDEGTSSYEIWKVSIKKEKNEQRI